MEPDHSSGLSGWVVRDLAGRPGRFGHLPGLWRGGRGVVTSPILSPVFSPVQVTGCVFGWRVGVRGAGCVGGAGGRLRRRGGYGVERRRLRAVVGIEAAPTWRRSAHWPGSRRARHRHHVRPVNSGPEPTVVGLLARGPGRGGRVVDSHDRDGQGPRPALGRFVGSFSSPRAWWGAAGSMRPE